MHTALSNNAVAHAAIGQPASHFLAVEVVRESQLGAAGFFEGLHLLGGQVEIEAGEIVLQLGNLPRSKYRYHRNKPVAQSSESHFGDTASGLLSHRLQRGNDPFRALLLGKEFLHFLP